MVFSPCICSLYLIYINCSIQVNSKIKSFWGFYNNLRVNYKTQNFWGVCSKLKVSLYHSQVSLSFLKDG